MNFDYLFVLTYSRSGSTLIQGILNEIPGVLIRGENNAALRHIIRAFRSIESVKASMSRGSEAPTSPWFGIGDARAAVMAEEMAASFTRNVLRPEPDTLACGFKEIRYHPAVCPDLNGEVDFMRRFFRRAGFVVNTRNLDDVNRSVINGTHKVTPDDIRASDERLRTLIGSPDVFHVHYDDYVASPGRLQPLFAWLGAEWNEDHVLAALSRPHSTRSKFRGGVPPTSRFQ